MLLTHFDPDFLDELPSQLTLIVLSGAKGHALQTGLPSYEVSLSQTQEMSGYLGNYLPYKQGRLEGQI